MVLFKVIAVALLLSFFACCVGSAVLQFLAWNHVREGQGPTVRGLWKPDGFFDEVGERQMKLARWLLILGGVAFVSHIIVLRVAAEVAG